LLLLLLLLLLPLLLLLCSVHAFSLTVGEGGGVGWREWREPSTNLPAGASYRATEVVQVWQRA
jgi:hypothetical protein